ncbi:MAG: hypothetical protein N2559_18560, partial [Anaerolineae bacterium]|nr:hypothetical protein [Anaerolineae bacterium]
EPERRDEGRTTTDDGRPMREGERTTETCPEPERRDEGRTATDDGRPMAEERRTTDAIAPAPPASPVPKSRAQEWREQLERALEEARRAREGKTE